MSEIYERLRERLDMFPQGFPKTKSGVELKVLKQLFSPEEAEIMLFLRPYPEPVASVSERMDRSESEMADILFETQDELIQTMAKGTNKVYPFQ